MLGYDAPRWHAALNDLPVALLIAAVFFDLGAALWKRESLKWAGIWTLWAAVLDGDPPAEDARTQRPDARPLERLALPEGGAEVEEHRGDQQCHREVVEGGVPAWCVVTEHRSESQ